MVTKKDDLITIELPQNSYLVMSQDLFVTQWNKGQKLAILGLQDGTEVQFGNEIVDTTLNRYVENGVVAIPDIMLTYTNTIYAYVEVVTADSQTTKYKICILVEEKTKPSEYIYPEDEQSFREFVEEAMETAKKSAEEANEKININEEILLQIDEKGANAVESINNVATSQIDAINNTATQQIKVATESIESFSQSKILAMNDVANAGIGNLQQTTTQCQENISDLTNQKLTDINTITQENINAINDTGSQLETVITNADSIKTDLHSEVVSANETKLNLDSSIVTANSIYQSLQNENVSAHSNLEELRSENFNSQEILTGLVDLRAYLGLTDDNILGLQVDYKNKTFTRIAGAVNMTAGADFDKFKMYGGRKRCNVSDDGTITAYYGDDNYAEDGSNGQVMVYQPKFYYLVYPVVYEPIDTGIGYHLRKANYYVTEKARTGFKLHPAFYDANGNELDYILISAYEGSIYDTSESAYLFLDEQVMNVNEDKLCSIAGVKPASGHKQRLTRQNIEIIAQNRGVNWHLENSKILSMKQLLCMIEMGTMNFQTAIGNGVINISDNSSYNCASLTGSTASLGNSTGMATETVNEKGGSLVTETVAGKTSVSYRGVENDWGNIFKMVNGINIWGNGAMDGGEPFYCDDFNFAENKITDNYKGAGFTITNESGYISAMGYSPSCDWLFMASESLGNSSLPVGDRYTVVTNLNDYTMVVSGGYWMDSVYSGGFCSRCTYNSNTYARSICGRLVYIPTANV